MIFSYFFSNREEVRAPIPQKQEILVEPEPLFGGKLTSFDFVIVQDFNKMNWRSEGLLKDGLLIYRISSFLTCLYSPPGKLHSLTGNNNEEEEAYQKEWLSFFVREGATITLAGLELRDCLLSILNSRIQDVRCHGYPTTHILPLESLHLLETNGSILKRTLNFMPCRLLDIHRTDSSIYT